MSHTESMSDASTDFPLSAENEASELFVQRLYGEWTEQDQQALEARLAGDSVFAQAYKNVEASWRALDAHADAPEILTYRAEAIETLRRANARRWFQPESKHWFTQPLKVAAAIAGLAMLLAVWQVSPYGYHPGEYRTAIGEQRIIELEDHSRISIDASTHLRVRYTSDARNIQLLQGQAQFSVAKDPSRPFKVTAGSRTIVAVGTVFTVEYVDRNVHVAMMEGKVAVLAPATRNKSSTSIASKLARSGVPAAGTSTSGSTQPEGEEIYLTTGQELRVAIDGSSVFTAKADIAAATAWREGKVIFRTTPLVEAANRMNRYSHLQIEIDDASLAAQTVSGVFEAGDTVGFVTALQRYLPVSVDYLNTDRVQLKLAPAPTTTINPDPTVSTQGG